MALSAVDSSKTQPQESVCPHCGRSVDTARTPLLETVLSALAGLVLALILVPLAVIVWRSCADFLSNRVSHSILYHPLEDWTQ